ncbi:hypothetical protein ABFA25_11670 [Mycobacterium lepromatosis]|uniref:hypothetical protein n=1 Tax=Mycobacterium lepromatosis TaxID=480418 RepID=UPI003D8078DB
MCHRWPIRSGVWWASLDLVGAGCWGGAFGCMLWLWGVCLFTGPRPAGVPPAVLVPCWFHSSSMTSQPVMTRTAVL